MIKSLGFVPKSVTARAGWLVIGLDRINGTGKPSALAGGTKYGDLRVSYHRAMAEEFYFCLLPLLWLITRMQGGLKL